MTQLAELTTVRLGGPAGEVVDCLSQESLIEVINCCADSGRPVLLLGGGSNLLVSDDGFDGSVARILTRGVDSRPVGDRVIVTAQAGEPWDRLVHRCVDEGLVGIECLAGIPGSVGATPIQNVGAYGQDVEMTVHQVVVYDRATRKMRSLSPTECVFSYRSSIFKRQMDGWVVLEVAFALRRSDDSEPIRYAELARHLGVTIGETAPLPRVRDAVLQLRRAKGMVLDLNDPDTVSAGSFFLNPLIERTRLPEVRARVHAVCGAEVEPPTFEAEEGKVKLSAAWLIERAGFHRGYGDPAGIAISSKHTLALTNRGNGTTAELVHLAQRIAAAVRQLFGIELRPEPVFVGHTWHAP